MTLFPILLVLALTAFVVVALILYLRKQPVAAEGGSTTMDTDYDDDDGAMLSTAVNHLAPETPVAHHQPREDSGGWHGRCTSSNWDDAGERSTGSSEQGGDKSSRDNSESGGGSHD